VGCHPAAHLAEAQAAVAGRFGALEIFTGRSEGQKVRQNLEFCRDRVSTALAEGAANNQIFCPSDLPVKKSGSVPYVFSLASD
jgi:hypothetical protein